MRKRGEWKGGRDYTEPPCLCAGPDDNGEKQNEETDEDYMTHILNQSP
jgi:hypothetical protein